MPGKPMKTNKLQQEVIEDFLRSSVDNIESMKLNWSGKKAQEKIKEQEWALKMICEKADLSEVLEKVKQGRTL